MGEQLETEMAALQEKNEGLKDEVEFWKTCADAPAAKPGNAASEYAQSECENWFSAASDEDVKVDGECNVEG